LIELLVVVSIVALLVAILIPSLRAARDQAKKVKCMANLRSIGLSLHAYANDNRQYLPAYETIGRYTFRMATRTKMTPSAAEESWGIQSVLEAGRAPEVLPNGLAYPIPVDIPVYLPSNSEVWLCPANPGPKGYGAEWRRWGNSYAYFCNSNTDYSLDHKTFKDVRGSPPLLWDNYKKLPGETGFIGPFATQGYTVPEHLRRAAHRSGAMSSRGLSAYWIAYYADDHIEFNGLN
jgi:type II secretory pathway pseudopilin PulG